MAIFNSYVSLPEGTFIPSSCICILLPELQMGRARGQWLDQGCLSSFNWAFFWISNREMHAPWWRKMTSRSCGSGDGRLIGFRPENGWKIPERTMEVWSAGKIIDIIVIYSGFTHWKWWFSIVMLVYQRANLANLRTNMKCKRPCSNFADFGHCHVEKLELE